MGELTKQTDMILRSSLIGEFFIDKYKKQLQDKGAKQTASNLRKMGVPIEITKAILGIK